LWLTEIGLPTCRTFWIKNVIILALMGRIGVTVGALAPGLFSADGSGTGSPAGDVVGITRDGTQTVLAASFCSPFDCTLPRIPVVPGAQVYLILFGTGIRGRSGLAGVSVTIGGTPATVTYAGPQGSFPALDQIDVLVPASLAGAGPVSLKLVVDGFAANTLQLQFQQSADNSRHGSRLRAGGRAESALRPQI
jgi:uncharacterized protein (TIGR03437 family)